MFDKDIQFIRRLMVVRDVTGFSAEYLIQKLHHFEGQEEQHLICTLCSNLHRATHLIEVEVIKLGMQRELRPYSHHSFSNLNYLEVDLVEVVKQHIGQKEKNQQALGGKGQSIFRSF